MARLACLFALLVFAGVGVAQSTAELGPSDQASPSGLAQPDTTAGGFAYGESYGDGVEAPKAPEPPQPHEPSSPSNLPAAATPPAEAPSETPADLEYWPRSCSAADPSKTAGPLRLRDCLLGDDCPWDLGGWSQVGYHSDATRLSVSRDDNLDFNDLPGRLNLHQQWFFIGKEADGSNGLDLGFRCDFFYGTDFDKSNSYGNNPGVFDFENGWETGGGYGYAMPQLYGEVAYGDWSVIAGHFYTLIGYEPVTAPEAFFYSHSFMFFNTEPFTHTGVLGKYSGIDGVDLYAGYTLGWDTGFDQRLGGSNWLGGLSVEVSDNLTLWYVSTAGNFGERSQGAQAYNHTILAYVQLTDRLEWVVQNDLLTIAAEQLEANDQVGVGNYLYYTLNDRWKLGGRAEWWKTDGDSVQGITYGANYRPQANIVVRPEVRHNWTNESATSPLGDRFNQTVFAIDCVLTY